jgi:hypothetical protein
MLKCGVLDSVIDRRRVARHLAPVFLVICLVSLSGLCFAEELEAPDAPDVRDERGSVFALGGVLELDVPVQDRIGLKFYGFYFGVMKSPVAQVDVATRLTKFLTITPSYLYVAVPASGVNNIVEGPGGFTDTYEEHQFRVSATFRFSIHNFQIFDRNMYVRRFPSISNDLNRYRQKILIAHPIEVKGHIWNSYASYEAFHDWRPNGGWIRNRVGVGVTLPLAKHVSFQPWYFFDSTQGLKKVNLLLFGLIFST